MGEKLTSAQAQAHISGLLVARMIIEFHDQMRNTYGLDVMTSNLCAVGPLQSMIGLAIKNGHLKIAGRAALEASDE